MLKRFMLIVLALVGLAFALAVAWLGPHIGPILLTPPKEISFESRLRQIPREGWPLVRPVELRWNRHAVPFIRAESDDDAAFVLGAIHAHLRLGQMELSRRLTQGRLSETFGPFAEDLDITLRTIDLGRAVPGMLKSMPRETRRWLDRFVAGINFMQDRMARSEAGLPHEFKVLQIEPETWTAEDVLRIGRLAGADISWMTYAQFLKLRTQPDWQEVWRTFIQLGGSSTPSFSAANLDPFSRLISHVSRSGSNSLVVSGSKTNSGAALIANDPHLGIFAPNIWLLAGVRSPSYQMVGMMIPGLPFMALGRNLDIAWGGTNMRAISSHLYRLKPGDLEKVTVREESLKVRGWMHKKIRIRETPWGPILTDTPFFKGEEPLALQWVGHQNSDELTAFLKANRASNFNEFRAAFGTYAVSAQNILYADKAGNVGQLLAYRQPVVANPAKQLELIKETDEFAQTFLTPLQLPSVENPEDGILASANNRPATTDVPLAFRFSSNDRVERLRELSLAKAKLNLDDLKEIQADVFSASSYRLKSEVIAKAGGVGRQLERAGDDDAARFWRVFSEFDGNYRSKSRGPVAFEMLMRRLADHVIGQLSTAKRLGEFLIDGDDWKGFLLEQVKTMAPEELESSLVAAAREGASGFVSVDDWGEMHRMRFGHPFADLPLVGGRYLSIEYGADGSNDTINKSGHRFSTESGEVTYGACARQLSDLSDPDENYFVLLGGQDGWLKNPQLDDQVELFRSMQYFKMPLSERAVAMEFPIEMTLR